ncbi:nucleotidyltransferase family protein [Caloranaerobacter ferrireducens]|uniref:nucleotidyltransferase family protein n=1 Tax=Caloranaerobacter ferrireducens TaxID=1323370 RepID=UPI000AE797A9|nr:nucleotidyltransferase family protein [Caloranaerobacter ferrireducens]
MINSIILAGKSEKKLNGKYTKALVSINGKPMISYVIKALKESGVVDKIVVIGDRDEINKAGLEDVEFIIQDRGSIIDNVIAGVDYFKEDSMILISTCDIPLLTGEAVYDFVKKSLESKADVCYPIIEKSICLEKYPEAVRTYAKLKDGYFTGGNLILINPKVLDRCIIKAKQMIEYRKNPVKMSKVLGFTFLLKLVVGRLTIESAEKRVSKILRLKPKAIITSYPEIGNDVDKPEDLNMAEKYLS